MLFVEAAEAYIGPGPGLGAVGAALALLGAMLLMVVGFVWYPAKRLIGLIGKRRALPVKRREGERNERDETED